MITHIVVAACVVGVEFILLLVILAILIYKKYKVRAAAAAAEETTGTVQNTADDDQETATVTANGNVDAVVEEESPPTITPRQKSRHTDRIIPVGGTIDSGVPTTSDPEPPVASRAPTVKTIHNRSQRKSRRSKHGQNKDGGPRPQQKSVKMLSKDGLQNAKIVSVDSIESSEARHRDSSDVAQVKLKDATKIIFQTGWRRTTSAANLLHSGLLSKGVVDALRKQTVSVDEVTKQLKENLVGLPPISGFLNMKTNEVVPLLAAFERKILTKDQLLLFLEAQVSCGNVYDIVKGQKLPVEAAIKHGVVPTTFRKHLTTVEGAVYGFVDPRNNEMLSTFQAMDRRLLERALCLRILAVQISTGGMVNPFLNHRVPTNRALSARIIDAETLKLLQPPHISAEYVRYQANGTTQLCTYADLLSSSRKCPKTGLPLAPYYPESKYDMPDPAAINNMLLDTNVQSANQATVHQINSIEQSTLALRRQQILLKTPFATSISLQELEDIGLVDPTVVDAFITGDMPKAKFKEIMTPVLRGTSQPIGGIMDHGTKHAMTVWSAFKQGYLKKTTAVNLLEAQAACGALVDGRQFMSSRNPKHEILRRINAFEAMDDGLIEDGKIAEKLQRILESVTKGVRYVKPNGFPEMIPMYQALMKGVVADQQTLRVLDAQLATGGFIIPGKMIRLPLDKARSMRLLDDRTDKMLTEPKIHEKPFYDPGSRQNRSYRELLGQCVTDEASGLTMLVLHKSSSGTLKI